MALLSVDDALSHLLRGVVPIGSERVGLAAAGGRILAEDLPALRTQPPADLSAMDGYAVRAEDIARGGPLTVIGEAAAGHAFAGRVATGQAVRIFTGAPVPDGADAVVIQEQAERNGDGVTFARPVPVGSNIRRIGADFTAGQVGLLAGTRLGMGQIGLAAAMNHAELPVSRKPRVAVIATGDELVEPGTPATDGRIVASNSYAIGELVRQTGGEAFNFGIAPDDMPALRATIRRALDSGADVVVLTGGASVGDHDHTRPALMAEGVEMDFWKIAMRPGKPLMFGRHGKVPVLGLPGNPVSSMVCGVIFLGSLLRALLGAREVLPPLETARLAVALPANDIRRDFMRATLTSTATGVEVTPVRSQDSALLSMIAAADALIIRPEHAEAAPAGAMVDIVRLA